MTEELKAVIFDFGGVFTDSPFHAFTAYAAKIGASDDQVSEIVFGGYDVDGDHPWHRVERGEVFTLARNYLAVSATIEMTPLLMLIPNVFLNLEDPSTLLQVVAQYSWKQNVQVTGAVNLPIGASGTEYGGIEAPVDGMYFSTGPSLFAQLAWYF